MKNFIIFLCLILQALKTEAQIPQSPIAEDVSLLSNVFSPLEVEDKYAYARNLHSNEYIWLLSKLFLIYKNHVSSQDSGSCNFKPSCSEYAMISVKELGPLRGVLNGFDRLTRCHPGIRADYPLDKDNLLMLYDPLIILK